MTVKKFAIPLVCVAALVLAGRGYGWPGVALVGGGVVMWLLLHFTRMLRVLQRAANRPVGYVGSAVMLNAKLKPGMSLLHVVAMTQSLGQLLSEREAQPEVFRWSDGGASHVTCEFAGGKLASHALSRPDAQAGDPLAVAAQTATQSET